MPVDTMPAPPTPAAGVHQAKQARSRIKHEALLAAGQRLLMTRDLAELSVARLTREAGMAVGSFYSRFADKDAWFHELLRLSGEQVLAQTQWLLASRRFVEASDARKVALFVRHIVDIFRTHRGIFRAALGDAARAATFGRPFHTYGQRIAVEVHAALGPRMLAVPARARRERIGIAMQLVYGTLVSAVLHDPGPIALKDPRMERELTEVFSACVRLG